jgi:hypothetical protein
MKDLSQELEKLSNYYDSEMIIDEYTMSPVYEFIHKKTGKKYTYRLSMTDVKDFGPGLVKMFDELKIEIRDEKLNDLGL